MLKTIAVSSNAKTGPIATTYRAGNTETFGTCPNSCPLKPEGRKGTPVVDDEYLAALKRAVPRNGQAWTYTHFNSYPTRYAWKAGETVINASFDDVESAARASKKCPAVYAAPVNDTAWPRHEQGVQFVRCPAETRDGVTCASCGNGRPLCARGDRDYVVVFVAHGTQKKRVGSNEKGGCYAGQGRVYMAWNKTRDQESARSDADAVLDFAASLPPGYLLRHHVAGDLGLAL